MQKMKYLKKSLLLLFMSLLLFFLTACIPSGLLKKMKNPVEDSSDARFRGIMEALENKDSKAMKKLFSPNALKEADDFDVAFADLTEYFQGKVISSEGGMNGRSSTNHYPDCTEEKRSLYTVKTRKGTYRVSFIDKTADHLHPDNVGLYMLEMIKENDTDNDWGEDAGIYRPLATNLDVWLGDYEFTEYGPNHKSWKDTIHIYKEEEKYVATNIFGRYPMKNRMKAEVIGYENKIRFIFDQYLPESLTGEVETSGTLLLLKRHGFDLVTEWGNIQPALSENKKSGIHFTKTIE
jgi:hypothetical protein